MNNHVLNVVMSVKLVIKVDLLINVQSVVVLVQEIFPKTVFVMMDIII